MNNTTSSRDTYPIPDSRANAPRTEAFMSTNDTSRSVETALNDVYRQFSVNPETENTQRLGSEAIAIDQNQVRVAQEQSPVQSNLVEIDLSNPEVILGLGRSVLVMRNDHIRGDN